MACQPRFITAPLGLFIGVILVIMTGGSTHRRGYQPPASPSAARGGCAPQSSRRPATATTRGASFDDLVGGDGQPEVARNVDVRHDSRGRSTVVEERQTVMDEDIPLSFDLPAVARKKVSAAFDGGRITSDGGVILLAQAERQTRCAEYKPVEVSASWRRSETDFEPSSPPDEVETSSFDLSGTSLSERD
jgi:hypothetical protein